MHFMQHNFVFQLTFYPFQDKINKLPLTAYNHDTVQIHSRRRSHYISHSDSTISFKYGYTPDTEVILLLIHTSAIKYRLDTLQTRKPFYFSFRYSSDTLQTRKPFCYLFRFKCRYSSDTFHIQTPFWCLFFWFTINILGWYLQAHLQQDSNISPNGIFKAIPSITLLSSANLWAL